METEQLSQLNKKIAELKKRILLSEGQKSASSEEWGKQQSLNAESVGSLKKNIRDINKKLALLQNPLNRRIFNTPSEVGVSKSLYPNGSKNTEGAVECLDLKFTEHRKQLDLLHDKYRKKQSYFNKLVEEYKELLACKDHGNSEVSKKPPETLEEDENRKLVCHLENEIHRTNVQWMEAEHIRKKYRSIKASLMSDAERFESSLKELEEALTEQQSEIQRLQEVNKEAIEMRDSAKFILQKQEQQANVSWKARERQALDFRKQVEERKLELERIERKLFSTSKTLVHQDSLGSSSGRQQTGNSDVNNGPMSELLTEMTNMEVVYKQLMEKTGATNPQEVLMRFYTQKEASSRLNYLRTAAEAEKKHLENQRELLLNDLDSSKFSDVKESDINQELLDQLKSEIAHNTHEELENLHAADRTEKVILSIHKALFEMIFHLQEVDEVDVILEKANKKIPANDLQQFLTQEANDSDLLHVLKEKINQVMQFSVINECASDNDETNDPAVGLPISTASGLDGKPQPIPLCYYNLISGRNVQSTSASPGQTPQPTATDDENEVPSRNYLKRQSELIVDAKSRRKGFRPTAQRRK